ncbi:MAG: hypothetical protein L0Z73_15345 [Gammaproteobacteria bacterium]|nr:hypothetical protein [Gammaproteobacteria bacterium]
MHDYPNNPVFILIAVFMMLAPAAGFAGNTNDDAIISELIAAEKAKDWVLAGKIASDIERSDKSELKTRYANHFAKLRKTIADLELAAVYHGKGETGKAVQTLTNTAASLEGKYESHDLPLLETVLAQLQLYKDEQYKITRQELDQEYQRVLDLEKSNQLDKAVTRLTALINKQGVDQITLAGYRKKLNELELEQNKQANPEFLPGLWKEIYKELKGAAKPFFYVIALYLLYLAYRLMFRPYRGAFYEIALEDQSGSAKNKNEEHHLLSQEFDQALKHIVGQINEGGELNGLINLGGAELTSMSAGQGAASKITEYLNSDPIKIGVLTFSPKSFFDLLRYATRTRGEKVITGALFKEDNTGADSGEVNKGEYVLRIETKENKYRIVQRMENLINSFRKNHSKTTGLIIDGRAKTREAAISQVAMQLVVRESQSTVTGDWRSLEAMVNAKKILDNQLEYSLSAAKSGANEGQAGQARHIADAPSILDNLEKAKALLQKSLAIDPSNWIARFRLANILSRIGENHTAYWQYSYVLDMLTSKAEEDKTKTNLISYVSANPLFPLQVLYNKIFSMVKMGADNMNSNTRSRREDGFKSATTGVGDLKLLADSVQTICVDKQVTGQLKNLLDSINVIVATYGKTRDDEGKDVDVVRPLRHTTLQLEMLNKTVYKGLLAALIPPENASSSPEIAQRTEGVDEIPDQSQKPELPANIWATAFRNMAKRLREQGFLKKNEPILAKYKLQLNDLVFQTYAGTISAIASLYEYHSGHPGESVTAAPGDLFVRAQRLEGWIYDKRKEMMNENRNAYAYSHALAHNALGRMHYIRLKDLIADARSGKSNQEDIKNHFTKSEEFLRWAIGYHLPEGFAEPYINLATLYLKSLDYPELRHLLPTEWQTRTDEYLTQATRLSPNNQKAHYLLGRLYQSRRDEDKLLSEDEQKTNLAFTNKALEEYKNAREDSFSYYRAGQIYYELEEFERALVKLKQCMSIYQRYDTPHQLYLEVAAKHLTKEYRKLAENYSEDRVKAVEKTLQEALNKCENLNKECISENKINPAEQCSKYLDVSNIRESAKTLSNLKSQIEILKEKHKISEEQKQPESA